MDISVFLGAIRANLLAVRARLPKGVKLTFMVKADAYHHGLQRVAWATKDLVDNFGVATAREGALLRFLGIENRILVTAFADREADAAELYRLTPILGTLEALKRYVPRGKEFDIALDSGMCRLGLFEAQIDQAKAILQQYNARPRAFCTHLATTDLRREVQLSAFSHLADMFCMPCVKRHVANSDAILSASPMFLQDEVRVGIAAYGAIDGYGMLPAMRVTAPVEFVKPVSAGALVGYDGLYQMPQNGELAFVRAGYYDGILRALRGAKLFVNGKMAPIAGNISMDSFMLDVTGLGVKAGDTVEYISNNNSATALARYANTISYEILTSLKGRNVRKYEDKLGYSPTEREMLDE